MNDIEALISTTPHPVPTVATRSRRQARVASTLAWRDATQFDRLGLAYELIHARGGEVITLRLHLDALIQVTGSADPVRTMSRRLSRAFARAGLRLPHYAFALEVTSDNRNELHLHGAVDLDGLSPDAVKNIFRDAAGRIEGRAGSRQVQLKNFDVSRGGPIGWADYTKRGAARTAREIDQDRVTYIHDDLRRLTRMEWEARRAQRQGTLDRFIDG
ncbi:hypothetical protein [Devosia sp. A369]